jgi:hypothetical protein
VAAHVAVKFWRTWAFALLALGLGAYIYLVERPRLAEESAPDRVLDFPIQEVSTFTLRYPDVPEIEIARDQAEHKWRIRRPIDFAADGTTVESLLRQISEAKAERRIKAADAEPLKTYGLDGDGKQARVSVTLEDGTKLPDLIVGETTPVGYNAFARVEGREEIVVVPLLLHTGVKKTVADLREKQLFDVDPTHVITMEIGVGERTVRMERRGDEWMIVAPVETPADPDQARALVSSLNAIRATEFYDTPVEGGDGTDTPTNAFTASLGEGLRVGFRLGRAIEGPSPGYYLRRDNDGQVVKVDPSVYVQFDKDRSALRNKHLFTCSEQEIAEAKFERADGAGFALKRSGDDWSVSPPAENGSVRQSIAQRTVVGLATLAGNEVASENAAGRDQLSAFGLDSPTVVVELLRRDGSSCGRALAAVVGSDSPSPAHYVMREDSGLVTTLPSYLFSRLDVRRDDLIAKKNGQPANAPAQ